MMMMMIFFLQRTECFLLRNFYVCLASNSLSLNVIIECWEEKGKGQTKEKTLYCFAADSKKVLLSNDQLRTVPLVTYILLVSFYQAVEFIPFPLSIYSCFTFIKSYK